MNIIIIKYNNNQEKYKFSKILYIITFNFVIKKIYLLK